MRKPQANLFIRLFAVCAAALPLLAAQLSVPERAVAQSTSAAKADDDAFPPLDTSMPDEPAPQAQPAPSVPAPQAPAAPLKKRGKKPVRKSKKAAPKKKKAVAAKAVRPAPPGAASKEALAERPASTAPRDPDDDGVNIPQRRPAPPAFLIYEEVVVLPKKSVKAKKARPRKRQQSLEDDLPPPEDLPAADAPSGDGGDEGYGAEGASGEEKPSGEPEEE